MSLNLKQIIIDNFKSYSKKTCIDTEDLSVFMGANSSGKSTALQALLILKQTIECNSPGIDLLLSGKYVMLGDFREVLNDKNNSTVSLGIGVQTDELIDEYEEQVKHIFWEFVREDASNQHVKLSNIKLVLENDEICYRRRDADSFDIIINGKSSQVGVRVNNLLMKEYYVLYDTEFNKKYIDFMNKIIICLFGEKTILTLDRNSMCAIDGFSEFFSVLYGKTKEKQNNTDDSCMHIAKEIINLMVLFSKEQFPIYNTIVSPVPLGLIVQILAHNIFANDKQQKIVEILAEYTDILEMEKKREFQYNKKGEFPRRLFYNKQGAQVQLDLIRFADRIYGDALNDIIEKIFYVGPLREKPQGLYNLGFETVPKYVGATGAYFASVLLSNKQQQEYVFPNGQIEISSLTEALDEWALHLNIASGIDVKENNAFGFSVAISNTQNVDSDIMNVGIGTSQVLPVLITGLLSERGEQLIFEQPELHLHPYSQSRLADFFVALCMNGRRIIVESHSEYLIHRLRYHMVKGNITTDKLQLDFFQNVNGTSVQKGILSGFGDIMYPDDFKDETQQLLKELFKAVSKKEILNE